MPHRDARGQNLALYWNIQGTRLPVHTQMEPRAAESKSPAAEARGYGGNLQLKRELLRAEGHEVTRSRVKGFADARWQGGRKGPVSS